MSGKSQKVYCANCEHARVYPNDPPCSGCRDKNRFKRARDSETDAEYLKRIIIKAREDGDGQM